MEGYFIAKDNKLLLKYPPTFDHRLLKRWVEQEGGTYNQLGRKNGLNMGGGVTIHTFNPDARPVELASDLHQANIGLRLVGNFVEKAGTALELPLAKAKNRAVTLLRGHLDKVSPVTNIKGVEFSFEEVLELRKAVVAHFEDTDEVYIYEKGENTFTLTKAERPLTLPAKVRDYRKVRGEVIAEFKVLRNLTTFAEVLEKYNALKAQIVAFV